jgi:hypothetical protein
MIPGDFVNTRPTIAQLEEVLKGDETKQNIRILPDGQITSSSPVFAVVDGELALEALNNNILILEDPFRTGFECKGCDGEGHTQEVCKNCAGAKVVAQNENFNAAAATLTAEEEATLPPHFVETLKRKRKEQQEQHVVSGGLVSCRTCICTDRRGGWEVSGFEQCKICKGFGASLEVPQDALNRPTSGKVVSLGPLCKFLKAGDRVVYSNMMGHCIKMKRKDIFRCMREDEIMLRLHGTNPEKFQRKLS